MPELPTYHAAGVTSALLLPFSLPELCAAWNQLTRAMIRARPEAFSRDEWAYLLTFLAGDRLAAIPTSALGAEGSCGAVRYVLRPRGDVAVWLPNNVSLLGPLTLVVLSLTGARLRLKGGTRGRELTGAFLAFCREHGAPPLREALDSRVRYAAFSREDPRNAAWAGEADVRIVFGGDDTARAIHAHAKLDSVGLSFRHRVSEAWLDPDLVDADVCRDLLRVFAVYGQAGCTSPRRVVLIGADAGAAEALTERLWKLWPEILPGRPPVHAASRNVLSAQLAKIAGWRPRLVADHAAVLCAGELDRPLVDGPFTLHVVSGSLDAAFAALPASIQTIGHVLPRPAELLPRLAGSAVKRLVPLARMHDFGPVWDGHHIWLDCFERIEVG